MQQREIRVFLSSTFKDMDAERHHLVTRVFPQIRQLCYQRGVNFSEIDLRWGITEEAAKNGRTVQICLEEIERCRALGQPPFFIGFLGERYGWVPQEDDLAAYWAQAADRRYASTIRAALAEGISVTELEIRFAFLAPPPEFSQPHVSAPRAKMYFRAPELTQTLAGDGGYDLTPQGQPDPLRAGQLTALKQRLRDDFPQTLAVDGYQSVEAFGEAVKRWLEQTIDALYPAHSLPDSWQRRLREHQQYAAVRRRAYVPLTAFRDRLVAYLNQASTLPTFTPLLLTAASGMGKSAFLADLEATLAAKGPVFAHYVGADGDNTLENWRDRLLNALAPQVSPPSWNALTEALAAWSQRQNGTLVLLLDAVNQLARPQEAMDRLRQIAWPPQVALVMSATPDITQLARLDEQDWQRVQLPALSIEEREAVCAASLAQVSKSLSTPLTRRLVDDPACENPLFLRLTLEELCLHARHEALPQRLDALLRCGETGALFLAALAESDKDFSPPGLASRAARFIAASRNGLTHSELARLLADERGVKAPDHELLPLLARLAPYCQISDGRLKLLHGALDHALQRGDEMNTCRRAIVDGFWDESAFSLAERVWQLMALNEKKALFQALSDVLNVIQLYEYEPGLLRQVWGFSGVYEEDVMTGKLRQPFSWQPVDAAQLSDHFYAAIAIFTELRMTTALPAAAAWGSAIRAACSAPDTNPLVKANFYNTLAVLHKNQGALDVAEFAIREALGVGALCGNRNMARMLITLGGILIATDREEQGRQAYHNAQRLAMQAGDEETLAAIATLLARLDTQPTGAAKRIAEFEAQIGIAEAQPLTLQRQKILSVIYEEYAFALLQNDRLKEAIAAIDKAIAAVQYFNNDTSKKLDDLLIMRREIYQVTLRQAGG